jgi:hypothetical protein
MNPRSNTTRELAKIECRFNRRKQNPRVDNLPAAMPRFRWSRSLACWAGLRPVL